jgi:hypothetical protein
MIPDSQLDESDLEARIQKLTTSIALYSVEIDKRHDTILKQRDRIAQLEEMLRVAEEALKDIKKESTQGDETSTELSCHHISSDALAKLEAMRGVKQPEWISDPE